MALAAALTTTQAALAQHTRIICEASGDYGLTWHDNLTVWPGQRVDVRVRLELINTNNTTVYGFHGAVCQPILTGWQSQLGDTTVPFSFPGIGSNGTTTNETAYDGMHVASAVGATGRMAPFGAAPQGGTSTSGLITAFSDPGNVLRFAGSRNTTMLTDARWGLIHTQLHPALSGTYFSRDLSPVVFRYAINLSPRSRDTRTLFAQVPFESISGGLVKYYVCVSCTGALNTPVRQIDLYSATISVQPRCTADIAGNVQPNPANPAEPPRPLPDGSVTIEDLLYFLEQFELGTILADLDNGSRDAIPDGAVTIDDLLFFIGHFESGC